MQWNTCTQFNFDVPKRKNVVLHYFDVFVPFFLFHFYFWMRIFFHGSYIFIFRNIWILKPKKSFRLLDACALFLLIPNEPISIFLKPHFYDMNYLNFEANEKLQNVNAIPSKIIFILKYCNFMQENICM